MSGPAPNNKSAQLKAPIDEPLIRVIEVLTSIAFSFGAGVLTLLVAGVLVTRWKIGASITDLRPVLVFLFLVVSLTTYVVLSAKNRGARFRRAQAAARLAAEATRNAKVVSKPKTWGDVLEARLTVFAPIFEETKTPEPSAPADEIAPAAPTPSVETPANAMPVVAIETAPAPPPDPSNPEIERFALATQAQLESAIVEVTEVMNFGVRLYIGAACGELARRNMWPKEQGEATLVWALEKIGISEHNARAFARNVNEFARLDAFRPLIEGGRVSMVSQLDIGGEPAGNFWELLLAWQTDNKITLVPERYTVLIYSLQFDALTLGPVDIARGQRTYRLVIEQVLQWCGGTTIHTLPHGMAIAFSDPAQAIRTAIEIQQQCAAVTRGPTDPIPTVHVALDADLGVASADQYASMALVRAAQIVELTPPAKIYCTEDIARTLDLSEVTPVPFMETTEALPAMFTLTWIPLPSTEIKSVEYHHIGASTPAPSTALLDQWLEANKASL